MPITEPDDTYLYEAAKEYLVEIEKLCDKSGVQKRDCRNERAPC